MKLNIANREISNPPDHQISNLCQQFILWKKLGEKSENKFWVSGGEWENYNNERSHFYSAVLEQNFSTVKEKLSNFWRNELGAIVKEYAKFQELAEGNKLETFKDSVSKNIVTWSKLYNENQRNLYINHSIGNPWGLDDGYGIIPPKAARFDHNAQQIKTLLNKISHPIVAEIGGGYGGLVEQLNRTLPKFTYINFDLPETLLISTYYLSNILPEKKIFVYNGEVISDLKITDYDIMLMPSYLINSFSNKSVDLTFNSFSLSEMPRDVNSSYLKEIARITRSYFLHNNMDREGVINRGAERIPSSKYDIDLTKFELLYQSFDQFHGNLGDYKEYLYRLR